MVRSLLFFFFSSPPLTHTVFPAPIPVLLVMWFAAGTHLCWFLCDTAASKRRGTKDRQKGERRREEANKRSLCIKTGFSPRSNGIERRCALCSANQMQRRAREREEDGTNAAEGAGGQEKKALTRKERVGFPLSLPFSSGTRLNSTPHPGVHNTLENTALRRDQREKGERTRRTRTKPGWRTSRLGLSLPCCSLSLSLSFSSLSRALSLSLPTRKRSYTSISCFRQRKRARFTAPACMHEKENE